MGGLVKTNYCLPGLIEGEYYWDGGVVGYNSVEELLKRHHKEIDVVIINDFHLFDTEPDNSFMERSWTPYHLIQRLLDTVAREFSELKLELCKKYKVDIIRVCPDIPVKVDIENPSVKKANKVIRMAYDETKDQLKDINLKGKRVAYALAGGSLKGIYAHTGFVLYMKDINVVPVAVIGTSAGSIVGGYLCSNYGVVGLYGAVLALNKGEYIDKIGTFGLIKNIFKKFKGFSGLIKGEKLEGFLKEKMGVEKIEDCPIPFYAHTVNISRRREEIFEKGDLCKAIRASSSIPYAFQLVKI
jgi:predicted acylesterase/phospholipase RssA